MYQTISRVGGMTNFSVPRWFWRPFYVYNEKIIFFCKKVSLTIGSWTIFNIETILTRNTGIWSENRYISLTHFYNKAAKLLKVINNTVILLMLRLSAAQTVLRAYIHVLRVIFAHISNSKCPHCCHPHVV